VQSNLRRILKETMTDPNQLPETTADGRARTVALARLVLDDVTPTALVGFVSRGRCLIVGDEARSLAAARRIAAPLSCTVAAPSEAAPALTIVQGTWVVRGGRPVIRGALGDFEVKLAGHGGDRDLGAMISPPVERFDLIVDLSSPPLLRQAMLPLGYYAPGTDEAALDAVLAALPDMQGEFEKPRFFDYAAEICAHSRSGLRGCTRCIDACPAEAIVSIGEKIQVNPYLCQGGGACATTCPTGAITYAYPPAADLLEALRQALQAYRDADGVGPVLLVYDEASRDAVFGPLAQMPERVLPVQVEEVGSVGMDAWLAGLAYGADAVVILTSDRTPPQIVEAAQDQLLTARMILAGMGYDESSVARERRSVRRRAGNAGQPPTGGVKRPATFTTPKDKRGRLRLAIEHLHAQAPRSTTACAALAGVRPSARFASTRRAARSACELRFGLPDARAAGRRTAAAQFP
jgi:ferredoxin